MQICFLPSVSETQTEYYTHFISVPTTLREGSMKQNHFCNNYHRTMDFAESEGANQDHPVQLLAVHRTPRELQQVSESIVKRFLNSGRLWAVATALGTCSVPNHPLGEKPFHDTQPESFPVQSHAVPSASVTAHQRAEISACPSSPPHKKL